MKGAVFVLKTVLCALCGGNINHPIVPNVVLYSPETHIQSQVGISGAKVAVQHTAIAITDKVFFTPDLQVKDAGFIRCERKITVTVGKIIGLVAGRIGLSKFGYKLFFAYRSIKVERIPVVAGYKSESSSESG